MQAQMAHFPAEGKKHGGFDLYGGVFNSKLFGSVRAGDGNVDRSQSQSWSRHNNGKAYSPPVYSLTKNGADRQSPEETKKDLKVSGFVDSPQDMNRDIKAGTGDEGFAKNVNMKESMNKIGDSGKLSVDLKKENSKMNTPSDLSDSSMRSSPISDSYSLARKSSDASSCSSCGSVSGGGAAIKGGISGNVKVGGTGSSSHSGELSSGGSSSGESPTPESRGRSPSNKIVRSGFAKSLSNSGGIVAAKAPLGNVKHHAPVRSRGRSGEICPPPLKSGYSSSSSGEFSSGNVNSRGNVLPSGNIIPNGKATNNSVKGMAKADHMTGQVLGSGNVNYGHGSVIKGSGGKGEVAGSTQISGDDISLKRALSSKDPEDVKNAGNDHYKKGHFAEALLLYERAIALSPGDPLYHSNKSAALTGLRRLPEAVNECLEAIKLDPFYVRAHQRLATLYIRLGEIENAKTHLKLSGQLPDRTEMQKLEAVEVHLTKCIDARKTGDWRSVWRESNAAIMAGADSASQFFTAKAEALLKLQRLEEADAVLMAAPNLQIGTSARIFGIVGNCYVLLVQAQVDMALGRFENAVATAQRAARMDLYNNEVTTLLQKAQAVAYARKTGNDLFKACKFFEACTAYGEGLENDPMNAILLCNRAACRSKLGQWEKAVEDCTAALSTQPNYTKALLRRADSNAKLERWEESLRDYEALRREVPGDIQVAQSLFDVQVALKKSRGEEISKMKFGGEVEVVSSDDQFREAITAPGLAVVHFSSRSSERCKLISPFVDKLCKRYPCVNFLKVDVQENLFLTKSERVNSVPTFKIYKNGFKVEEIIGPILHGLENSIVHHSQ